MGVATAAILGVALVAVGSSPSAYASQLRARHSARQHRQIVRSSKKAGKRDSVSLRVRHDGVRFSASLNAPGESGCVISVSAANDEYTFPSIKLRSKGGAILKWRSGKNAPTGKWTMIAACRASGKVLRATRHLTVSKKARVARRVLARAASLPTNGELVLSASIQVQGAIVEGNTMVNLTAPAGDSTEQAAVNWALHEMQTDPSGYDYLCLPFVQAAYTAGGFSITAHTSGVAWNSNTYPDDVWGHTVAGTTGAAGTTPPVGALVFYAAGPGGDTGSEPSHVEIYVGNGWNIATADYYDDNTTLIHYEPYGAHPRELGWWLPDQTISGDGGSSGSSNISFGTDIAVGTNQDGVLQAFAVGSSGQMYTAWQTGGSQGFSGWASLGGSFPSDAHIAVGTNQSGALQLFAVGSSGQMYTAWQTAPNAGWSGWASLGGGFPAGAPVVVGMNTNETLQFFAVGTDGQVGTAWQTGPNAGWSGVASLGGSF